MASPPLSPMLLDERPLDLDASGWVYEFKYDGCRLMAAGGHGTARLWTRNSADATLWFPEIVESLSELRGGPYVFDGEVSVLDDLGRSDFIRLQHRARERRSFEGADKVAYCIFDLLMDGGANIMGKPLVERKRRLREILTPPLDGLQYVQHKDERGRELYEQAVMQLKLEGIVAKRADSIYQPGVRSRDWVKVKRPGAVPAEGFKR